MSCQSLQAAFNVHRGPGKMHRMYGMPEELPGGGNYRGTEKAALYQPGDLHQMRGMLFKVQV